MKEAVKPTDGRALRVERPDFEHAAEVLKAVARHSEADLTAEHVLRIVAGEFAFARHLAARSEREDCAKECEREGARHALNAHDPARGCDRTLAEEREIAAHQCAAAIRARSGT